MKNKTAIFISFGIFGITAIALATLWSIQPQKDIYPSETELLSKIHTDVTFEDIEHLARLYPETVDVFVSETNGKYLLRVVYPNNTIYEAFDKSSMKELYDALLNFYINMGYIK